MNLIQPPLKPFPRYKWRWATFQPTESLNDPPVFLGVLRAFNRFENYAPSSDEVRVALRIVQDETKTNVDLVRTPGRNLVRNSGQYWKALGLMEEAHGKIILTPFGKQLAEGKITQIEFATTTVNTLELPNRRIARDVADWEAVKLRIKPLQLILDVIAKLYEIQPDAAYITPYELRKITIPLAGGKASLNEHAAALLQFRNGMIDVTGWPNCAPDDNDKRMAREFLIFLSNYGFLKMVNDQKGNDNEKYSLGSISKEEVQQLSVIVPANEDLTTVTRQIRESHIPGNVERKKVMREVRERPYQATFRQNVLIAFNSTCLITGVDIEGTLEASHIIPVKNNGSDKVENGLCLRSDIHQLYDSGHLRLMPNGDLILSETAARKNNYGSLPKSVALPDFVNLDHIKWRWDYA